MNGPQRRFGFLLGLLLIVGLMLVLAVALPARAQAADPGLVGIPTGQIYTLGDDGFWHEVDALTFLDRGYAWTSITWYEDALPGAVGQPVAGPGVVISPSPPAAPVERTAQGTIVNVTPVIGTPKASPSTAVAGKKFKVTFPVVRGDTGDKLTSATMISNPKIGKTLLRHIEHFANGVATIDVTVPTAAKGKLLAVQLTMKVGDTSTTRTVSYRIG